VAFIAMHAEVRVRTPPQEEEQGPQAPAWNEYRTQGEVLQAREVGGAGGTLAA
jgi:hypothetical protein